MDKTADEDDWGCEYCRNDGRLDENGCCPKCGAEYQTEDDQPQHPKGPAMIDQPTHAEAILRAAVPVAWMYRRHDKVRIDHSPELSDDMMPGWEAEPLYPASAILDAVRAERAAIVAWLRSPAFSYGDYSIAREANFLAYLIKRGEHFPQDTPQ